MSTAPTITEAVHLAPAYGFTVVDQDPPTLTDSVSLDVDADFGVVLVDVEEETGSPLVAVLLVAPTWSYDDGPGEETFDFGLLTVRDALAATAWLVKMYADQDNRADAQWHDFTEEP